MAKEVPQQSGESHETELIGLRATSQAPQSPSNPKPTLYKPPRARTSIARRRPISSSVRRTSALIDLDDEASDSYLKRFAAYDYWKLGELKDSGPSVSADSYLPQSSLNSRLELRHDNWIAPPLLDSSLSARQRPTVRPRPVDYITQATTRCGLTDSERRDFETLILLDRSITAVANGIPGSAGDWEAIAHHFILCPADISNIKSKNDRTIALQRRDMLMYWREKLGSSATYYLLAMAFENAKRRDMIDIVVERFKLDHRALTKLKTELKELSDTLSSANAELRSMTDKHQKAILATKDGKSLKMALDRCHTRVNDAAVLVGECDAKGLNNDHMYNEIAEVEKKVTSLLKEVADISTEQSALMIDLEDFENTTHSNALPGLSARNTNILHSVLALLVFVFLSFPLTHYLYVHFYEALLILAIFSSVVFSLSFLRLLNETFKVLDSPKTTVVCMLSFAFSVSSACAKHLHQPWIGLILFIAMVLSLSVLTSLCVLRFSSVTSAEREGPLDKEKIETVVKEILRTLGQVKEKIVLF